MAEGTPKGQTRGSLGGRLPHLRRELDKKKKIMQKKEFFTNDYNIHIVKCCASCRFNGGSISNSTPRRKCMLDNQGVYTYHLCAGWQVKPSLNNAGSAHGRVKKPAYMRFLQNNVMKFAISDIREMFEKENGSIYSF